MDLEAFKASLRRDAVPAGLGLAAQGLWWDAKGDWAKAHECAQAQDDGDGAWLHAYLHRKEGDQSNAGYWYQRAGRVPATVSLEAEWSTIAETLLAST